MLKFVRKFLKYLEQCEKYESSSFWLCTIGLLFTITSFAFGTLSPVSEVPCQSQAVVVQLRWGGSSDKVGMDSDLHCRLARHFPDWEERMSYQKKQEEFYKSAMKRKREIKRLRLLDNKNLYSKDELGAMDYFNGTGFYQKEQDPTRKPNICDTRQTFLLKMHDDKLINYLK